jgi:hypothetical protein
VKSNVKKERLKALVEELGWKYSEILYIDLSKGEDEEVFKWFLASVLFGAPITEGSVIKTFNCFRTHSVLTPGRILETGWDGIVKILDEGGYARYDFKTADKLLEVVKNLMEKYEGSLTVLHSEASDARDLEKRLKDLGKGVGDVTVGIFFRELRQVWEKADPNPTDLVVLAAKNLKIVDEETTARSSLEQLKSFWSKKKVAGKSFVEFETALVRFGKDLRRKQRRSVLSS